MTPILSWYSFQFLWIVALFSIQPVSGFIPLPKFPQSFSKRSFFSGNKENNLGTNCNQHKEFLFYDSKTSASKRFSTSNDENMNPKSSHSNDNVHTQNPITLNWNLLSLLSRDPSTEPKLIALMDVYNVAVQQLQQRESLECLGDLPPNLAPFRRFCRKYSQDIGHDGRFTIFNSCNRKETNDFEASYDLSVHDDGASLQANVVFSMNDPLKYIREVLSYDGQDQSNKSKKSTETTVFVPGLHTMYEHKNTRGHLGRRRRTSRERLKYYSRVLEDLPMAQIHAGSYYDQKDVNIHISFDTLNSLQSFHLLAEGHEYQKALQKYIAGGCDDDGKFQCRLRTKDLDIIRVVLSSANMAPFHIPSRDTENGDDDQLKKTLISLIDSAVRSNLKGNDSTGPSENLALIVYSATCQILSDALKEWKEQATNSYFRDSKYCESKDIFSEEQAENLLRKSLTIVTISGLCKEYIDGPAYIHVSMHDDILVSNLGAAEHNPEGGGKDAVYLHGLSPYAPPASSTRENSFQNNSKYEIYDHDAHSMDACAIQYLSLIRRINGVSTFRQMYDFANDEGFMLDINSSLFAINYSSCKIGQLEMPRHLDDTLLPSMIRATGGERWLFNPNFQLGEDGVDGSESPLPSLDDAEAELTQQFGYDVYDEIVEACEVESCEE